MKEQLIQYVNLLFAGANDCEDMKQEILQNTLDRYDDLIAEGKVPEAAYRLAISGIGDLGEILGTMPQSAWVPTASRRTGAPQDTDNAGKKLMRAIAVALYILCPVPLFVLSELGMDTIGLCGLLAVVAVATALIILGAKKEPQNPVDEKHESLSPRGKLQKSISSLIWAIGLCVYLLLSFVTQCWYITWLIFPIIGALNNLVSAILDLKEAANNDN